MTRVIKQKLKDNYDLDYKQLSTDKMIETSNLIAKMRKRDI